MQHLPGTIVNSATIKNVTSKRVTFNSQALK